LESQIQFLEERLAAKKKKSRSSGRHSANPLSPVPTTVVKIKEHEIPKTFSCASSAAVTVKQKDLPNTEEKHLDSCSDKASILSAEEATDHFIAELKQEISKGKTSGMAYSLSYKMCIV